MSSMDDELRFELNMDHPLNKWIEQARQNLTKKQFDLLLVRLHRSGAVHRWLDRIGNMAACKRREVVRGFVDVFRQGFCAGHMRGYERGRRHERRRLKRKSEPKDGR